MAVGYTCAGPDIPYGTRFYLRALQRYAIVEDLCGACHWTPSGATWRLICGSMGGGSRPRKRTLHLSDHGLPDCVAKPAQEASSEERTNLHLVALSAVGAACDPSARVVRRSPHRLAA